ncbi:MAG: hypothetical protein AAF355_14230 [Myxococcota bacterium]
MHDGKRRHFIKLAGAGVAAAVWPSFVACRRSGGVSTGAERESLSSGAAIDLQVASSDALQSAKALPIPWMEPADWDAIAFNRTRGNRGAIPESYRDSINGPDGEVAHLGKHLPYIPEIDSAQIPSGMLPLMWGDPSKGHVKHPNASPTDDNPEGHYYNWIRLRKATADEAIELETRFGTWPNNPATSSGRYRAFGGVDRTTNSGKETVYVVQIPPDILPGDTIRVWGHCITHGQYVDFIRQAEAG